jgi:hypothetical protein
MYTICSIADTKNDVYEMYFIISYLMFGAKNHPINVMTRNTIVVIHNEIKPSMPSTEIDILFFVRIDFMTLNETMKTVAKTIIGTRIIFIC